MRLTISSKLVACIANDGQAIPFLVKAWDDTSVPWAPQVPTTLRYRYDDIDAGCNIVPWTSITADDVSTIILTGEQNTVSYGWSWGWFNFGRNRKRRRQLVVEADHGLPTNAMQTYEFWLRDIAGVYS